MKNWQCMISFQTEVGFSQRVSLFLVQHFEKFNFNYRDKWSENSIFFGRTVFSVFNLFFSVHEQSMLTFQLKRILTFIIVFSSSCCWTGFSGEIFLQNLYTCQSNQQHPIDLDVLSRSIWRLLKKIFY